MQGMRTKTEKTQFENLKIVLHCSEEQKGKQGEENEEELELVC